MNLEGVFAGSRPIVAISPGLLLVIPDDRCCHGVSTPSADDSSFRLEPEERQFSFPIGLTFNIELRAGGDDCAG
jgi:hypothetical protein